MKTLISILKNIGVIALAILVMVVGTIPGNYLMEVLPGPYLDHIIVCIVTIACVMLLAWLLSTKVLKISADELGIKPRKIKLLYVLLAILLPIAILIFYTVLSGRAYVADGVELAPSIVYAIFSAGLMAGVTEEVIFRGIIFRYMKKTLGTTVAVIVPAVLFAALHITNMETFNLTDLILLLLAGSSVAVMFTLMALKSGTIYLGAIAHSVWNMLIIGGIFGVGGIVNGMDNYSYLIIPIESQSKLLTGGNFGVEAAVPAIVGYIIVAVLVYVIDKKPLKNGK
ncbi:MAG: CPBP family intramembrane metalloprotease [Lachnospiraceae bacterium]|nr:CPBP family intramembrane metalloprotease [Lachnospiraceae bacterium]